jgi:hypothetical protein
MRLLIGAVVGVLIGAAGSAGTPVARAQSGATDGECRMLDGTEAAAWLDSNHQFWYHQLDRFRDQSPDEQQRLISILSDVPNSLVAAPIPPCAVSARNALANALQETFTLVLMALNGAPLTDVRAQIARQEAAQREWSVARRALGSCEPGIC